MKTIADLAKKLVGTRNFIWDVLPKPKEEFDVDEIAGLLMEGGFDLCPKCVCWARRAELHDNEEGICQECRDVAALYKIGGML